MTRWLLPYRHRIAMCRDCSQLPGCVWPGDGTSLPIYSVHGHADQPIQMALHRSDSPPNRPQRYWSICKQDSTHMQSGTRIYAISAHMRHLRRPHRYAAPAQVCGARTGMRRPHRYAAPVSTGKSPRADRCRHREVPATAEWCGESAMVQPSGSSCRMSVKTSAVWGASPTPRIAAPVASTGAAGRVRVRCRQR